MKAILNFIGTVSLFLLPLIWIWDVWDTTNEPIITRVLWTNVIILISTAVIAVLYKMAEEEV